ncbi:hypothetical protein H2200_012004 [Cladophialophora chaetospira]|uniref:Phytanoyl-CoA dioxygenase family protein n=1 Tax=Cladophialophora chaetospira TaxID=386627 RepID=A0AA39CD15_9EURO|nr:hypothetical protein H2200_012004 [Cladophialophora chaetospira]
MAKSDSVPDLAEARGHLKQEGWCVIPDVLSKGESSDVLARLWEAEAEYRRRGNDSYLPHLDPNPNNVRVFFLLELDEIFRKLISHPVATELVKSVVGDDYLISNFTANIARPGSQSMALHSDQSIVMPDPWNQVWAINIIWCLTDVKKENGATLFIPGSNKWERRAEIPENAPSLLRPFEAKAGSIIAMDGRVWHTSGSNVTQDEDRALLFGYYTASFLRQQVNWTAKLPTSLQDDLDEDLKRRLGLYPTANTGLAGDLRHLSVQFPGQKQAA